MTDAGVILDDETVSLIEKNRAALIPVESDFSADGVTCFDKPLRYTGACGCHIIGYLSYDNHGAAGIEKAFDDLLYGDEQYVSFAANSHSEVLCGVSPSLTECEKCGSVMLTISRPIQHAVERAMSRYIEKGAAVVLDSDTGEILALCSMPALDRDDLSSDIDDERAPFIDRTITPFGCGSVFKPVIAAAALEKGVNHTHNCRGGVKIGGVKFGCLHSHGKMTMRSALALSCNSYFITLGQTLGASSVYRMARLMGFGGKNVLCPGIVDGPGVLYDEDELDGSRASLANFSFGQGKVSVTPLQIASMIQCIANGGKRCIPTIIKSYTDRDGTVHKTNRKAPVIVMQRKSANTLKSDLVYAVQHGTGTVAKVRGMTVGGKTATAQTGIYNGKKERLIAHFAGFLEYGDIHLTIAVMAEDGISGSVSAAPVFREIATAIGKMA